MSPPSLSDLHAKLQLLETNLQYLNRSLRAYGLPIGLWLSPSKAAIVLGISGDRIKREIQRAEQQRATGKKGDLVYGKHYRNDQDPEAIDPTWKVNIIEFSEFLKIPPDDRQL